MHIIPGADPGFPVGGGPKPPGGGAKLQFCQHFPQNCIKLQKIWAMGRRRRVGGRWDARGTNLDPPLNAYTFTPHNCCSVDLFWCSGQIINNRIYQSKANRPLFHVNNFRGVLYVGTKGEGYTGAGVP